MSWQKIIPLITKDFMLFLRDKLFGFATIFCIVLFIIFYFIMPRTVDETIEIGFYAPKAFNMFNKTREAEGVIIRNVSSENELKQAVMDKQYHIGISIPGDIRKSLIPGKNPQIVVYYSSDIPDEMKEMYTIFIGEMINAVVGYKIKLDHIVLGLDMGGKQIPYRDRLLPILVFFLLIAGTFVLASLITSELENKTIQALLATPMKVIDLFVGKGFVGVLLAFSQAMILMTVTGNLNQNTILIIISLLLGSMMVTGLAFFIASISPDMMSVVAWGTLFVMILSIPAVTIIFPGPVSGWIKVIPSFYIVDTLHRAVNFDIGWSGNLKNIMFIIGFNIAFVFLGIITLKRKVQCALEE
ncbi:MAG: ABC transporter permease [Candidatus Aminicenantes bacterium]|nr:ABC transporter permease [Candidatus Aminicenantes bacterium]NIM83486.1 ABC transporter permease [Candidatus Aminicenantes bacterium]NIN22878.1 ABC transporter permease [Candidatus Aminicenantes bacterium]NIN46614.1 ABC transporter permease [Candidatus Aminicenantes bacterium]NIN89517.1 ABC transporter permease [Candidatus Aminicenantes bacterium]